MLRVVQAQQVYDSGDGGLNNIPIKAAATTTVCALSIPCCWKGQNIMEISDLPINPFACHIVQISVQYFYSLLPLVSPIYNIIYFCQYH